MAALPRLDSLTSLRFVAALAVFFSHLFFLPSVPDAGVQSWYRVFQLGTFGVSFFYTLSGFIISYGYHAALREGRCSVPDFLFFRAARLYPTHLLILGAMIIAAQVLHFPSVHGVGLFFANLGLVQSWIPGTQNAFSYAGVAWSLSNEAFYYSAFCLLVLLPTRALLALALALWGTIAWADATWPESTDRVLWLLYINPAFRILDFLGGMLLFRAMQASPRTLSTAAATAFELLALSSLAAFGAWMLGQHPQDAKAYLHAIMRADRWCVLPMVLVVAAFAQPNGLGARLLRHPWAILLGEASFGFYMVHWMLLDGTHQLFWPPKPGMAWLWVYGTAVLALCVVVSIAMFVWFERPCNRALRAWWQRRYATSGRNSATSAS